MPKNTLLLTGSVDTVDTEDTDTVSTDTSQRKKKIRKIDVFKSSELYLPIIVVIYLS